MRAAAAACLLAVAGCSLSSLERHASRRGPNATAARAMEVAREALIEGDAAAAEGALRAAVEADREYVPPWRILQDLQVASGRRAEALQEALAEHRREPDSARACYLVARVRQGTARRRWLERALERDRWFGWAELGLAGLAEAFDGPGEGLPAAMRALALLPNEPDAWLSAAESAISAGQTRYAWRVLTTGEGRFFHREPAFSTARLRVALSEMQSGDESAVARVVEELKDRLVVLLVDPAATLALAEAVHSGLPSAQRDRIEDALSTSAARPRRSARLAACHAWLGAALASASGRNEMARRALEEGAASGRRGSRWMSELRLARARARDYAGAVDAFDAWLSPFLPSAGEAAGARLAALRTAAGRATSEAPDAAGVLEFAREASAAGWIEEALDAAGHAERLGGGAEAAALVRELDGFRRFAGGVTRSVATAMRRDGAKASLEGVLESVARRGRRELGFDPTEGTRIETYFPVGALVDTSPGAPGLGRVFDSHGLELRMGRRFFGTVEAYVLRRVASQSRSGSILGRPYEGREVLGEGTSKLTRFEAGGSRIAGATLPGGLFLALDAIADEAEGLAGLAARSPSLDPAVADAELPVPEDDAERVAADEPFDVEARLVATALRRDPSPLAARTLEDVRLHELAHLADVRDYLPVLAHLPNLLSWLVSSGFSFAAIEARLERRAELAALCVSRDPDLLLARILSAGAEPASTPPHSLGFAALAADFVAEVDRRGAALPAIDRRLAVLPQLWKLSPEEIRSVARALAAQEGLVADGATEAAPPMRAEPAAVGSGEPVPAKRP